MATTSKLVTKRERIQAERAAELRQLVFEVDLPDRVRDELVHEIDRRTAAKRPWTFKMIDAEMNAEIGRWIRQSKRPLLAFALWHELPALIARDNEILATRNELAAKIGTDPDTVTKIMAEFEAIGVISRRRDRVVNGRGAGRVRYYLSPRIVTTEAGAARDKAQSAWPDVSEKIRSAGNDGRKGNVVVLHDRPAE